MRGRKRLSEEHEDAQARVQRLAKSTVQPIAVSNGEYALPHGQRDSGSRIQALTNEHATPVPDGPARKAGTPSSNGRLQGVGRFILGCDCIHLTDGALVLTAILGKASGYA